MQTSQKSQPIKFIPPIPGNWIKVARVKRGWTQRELAAKIHISRDTLAWREGAKKLKGELAAQFDAVFGGSAWRQQRETDRSEVRGSETAATLKSLEIQIAEMMKHVLKIERSVSCANRGGGVKGSRV